jgi:hypothetical protein
LIPPKRAREVAALIVPSAGGALRMVPEFSDERRDATCVGPVRQPDHKVQVFTKRHPGIKPDRDRKLPSDEDRLEGDARLLSDEQIEEWALA